jgi:hypothetical protein
MYKKKTHTHTHKRKEKKIIFEKVNKKNRRTKLVPDYHFLKPLAVI